MEFFFEDCCILQVVDYFPLLHFFRNNDKENQ